MSDRFSDTTEMPAPKPRPRQQHPQNSEQTREYHRRTSGQSSSAPQRPQTARERSVQNGTRSLSTPQRRSSQPQRRIEQPPRQRMQQPYPQPQFRRASYQEQMPDVDEQMEYRPQQQPQQYYEPEDYNDEPREPKRRKKRRRHHKSCLRRIISMLITLAVAFFALYSCIAMLAIKQLEYEETGTRTITSQIAEADPAVRNVLLIGTDNREDERGRADTMILLSFSKHNKTVTMTSLMRDCYVTIPNYGNDKLNAAFAYGGATLLMDTIVNNFGIQVDDYICVNFKSFASIVDSIGGVDITLTDREAEALNEILISEVNELMGDDRMADLLPSGGKFTLNGKQALSFARIRHVGNADFERTERQRLVLDQIMQKIKRPSPTTLTNIIVKALPDLKTNMTTGALYLLSLKIPKDLYFYQIQKLRLPAEGTFSDQTAPNGQMVLAVDYDANMQIYLKAVNDPLPKPEPETPEVTE